MSTPGGSPVGRLLSRQRNLYRDKACVTAMFNGICAACGLDMNDLNSMLESRALSDPIGAVSELSIWSSKAPGWLGRLRSRLRRRGWLRGSWWDGMSCKQRTRFLQSSLIQDGFQILFPEPVLTCVVHSEWESLNKNMRGRLELIRA